MEIFNLIKEYQYVFEHDYKDLKRLVKKWGELIIDLTKGAKSIKKRTYKLAHMYKLIVQEK